MLCFVFYYLYVLIGSEIRWDFLGGRNVVVENLKLLFELCSDDNSWILGSLVKVGILRFMG